ncbi:hypothetical protein P152DRAFT_307794 [Eremomyces bilateralis CBS 781.70]|uniref:AN1-type domain-containing protein n=1 Tax=Eremomyces bilateralis CBS 781.70 TaxID=1392243 RepID=A0A6G1G507_9PEZI|nr:uncharacterized protein P152DRAFT_307794 [Eremomyces bilateralis CBS 781.70]KAF1813175.1 hypothetical protein P152DRAFT_307794 [Eremomyces bilateralis CBS 781.70]
MALPKDSNSSSAEASSYSKMAVGDVEAIGAHCQMAFCHQLDFLPFRCESCKGTFCLDHRTESTHSCTNAGAWARARREALSPSGNRASTKPSLLTHEQQCSEPSCKTLVDTPLTPGVHCATCNRTYCLKHRMNEDHGCSKLTPRGARPGSEQQKSKEKGLAALQRLRAWGAAKKTVAKDGITSSTKTLSSPFKPKASSTSPAAQAQALAELKRSAKGDAKVPQEKRIYLHVEASADTTTAKHPTGKFYYSADWTIGRVLDAASKTLQVENVNNRREGEGDKLRVFHVEAGRLLEFSEKLGEVCKSGNMIVLLRGVGPPAPDLIEL